MSYIIGSALTEARDNKDRAELLVEGHWIQGQVTAVDGFGVVIERDDGSRSVIRIESIAAVEMPASSEASSRPMVPRQIAMAR